MGQVVDFKILGDTPFTRDRSAVKVRVQQSENNVNPALVLLEDKTIFLEEMKAVDPPTRVDMKVIKDKELLTSYS